jgi:hypothetical protein
MALKSYSNAEKGKNFPEIVQTVCEVASSLSYCPQVGLIVTTPWGNEFSVIQSTYNIKQFSKH